MTMTRMPRVLMALFVMIFGYDIGVDGHGMLVGVNNLPMKMGGGGDNGLYGARNFRARNGHQGSLQEWCPQCLAGQDGRNDPITTPPTDWTDIPCGEPGQTTHNIQYSSMNKGDGVSWIVPGSYADTIDFNVQITANHGGMFEFRYFCADGQADDATLSYLDFYDVQDALTTADACFQQNPESNVFYQGTCYKPRVLERVAPDGDDTTYFSARPEHFILADGDAPSCLEDNRVDGTGADLVFSIKYKLPEMTCNHMIVQWWWQTSNNCYFPSWKTAVENGNFPCTSTAWPTFIQSECVPGGDKDTGGEQFVNCLDLQVGTTSSPSPVPTPTPAPPPAPVPTPAPTPNVDGGWSAWGICSASCGGGTQTRTCSNPAPSGTGSWCTGDATRDCNCQDCPNAVDGGWTMWSECSKTCGGGVQTRSCTNPAPVGTGAVCFGDSQQYCNEQECAGNPNPNPTPAPSDPDYTNPVAPVVHGYVENWASGYSPVDTTLLEPYTAIFYSFLTLDNAPNAANPRDVQWDGSALYETMTLASIMDVMEDTNPAWLNNYNWQKQKIKDLMDWCENTGRRFIWAIGGWSDLKRTISDDQIETFVNLVVNLLQTHGGDGVDFDWEHLSDADGVDSARYDQQRAIVGKTIKALREAFDTDGDLSDKWIVYTPRYNGCFAKGDTTYSQNNFKTDGESLDVANYLADSTNGYTGPYGGGGVGAIDYVHFMMYDIAANEGFSDTSDEYFNDNHYDAVIQSCVSAGFSTSQLVMGYEPGVQAYTGVWAGMVRDKAQAERMRSCTAGAMFWAANDKKVRFGDVTNLGENCRVLASHVKAFSNTTVTNTCGNGVRRTLRGDDKRSRVRFLSAGTTTTRCGSDWTNADTNCNMDCLYRDECIEQYGAGWNCFANTADICGSPGSDDDVTTEPPTTDDNVTTTPSSAEPTPAPTPTPSEPVYGPCSNCAEGSTGVQCRATFGNGPTWPCYPNIQNVPGHCWAGTTPCTASDPDTNAPVPAPAPTPQSCTNPDPTPDPNPEPNPTPSPVNDDCSSLLSTSANPEYFFTACPETINADACRDAMTTMLVANPAIKLCPENTGAANDGASWCPVRGFQQSCWGYVGTGGDSGPSACTSGADAFATAYMRNAQTDDEKQSCAVVTAVMSHEGGFAPTAKSWDMFCNGGTTGAVGLFQYDFASGLNPMPAGVDAQFEQFFRGTRGPTFAGLSRFWMACNARISGATAASMADYNNIAIPACERAGAPTNQKLPSELSCTFAQSTAPAPTPSSSATRCGTTWSDANTYCRSSCSSKSECPANMNCYADVSGTCTDVPSSFSDDTPAPTPSSSTSSVDESGECTGCYTGSSGPCKAPHNDVCYSYTDGTTDCPGGTRSCGNVVVSDTITMAMDVFACDDSETTRIANAMKLAASTTTSIDASYFKTEGVDCVDTSSVSWKYVVEMSPEEVTSAGLSTDTIRNRLEEMSTSSASTFASAFATEAESQGLEAQEVSAISSSMASSGVEIESGAGVGGSDGSSDNMGMIVGIVVAVVVVVVVVLVAVVFFFRRAARDGDVGQRGAEMTTTA